VASSEVVVTGRGCIWVDFAGVALGQVWVLNKKIHCRSLISIHILYNHTPAAPLRPHPELCCGLLIFHWTEVVHIEMRTPGAHLKPPPLFEFHEKGCPRGFRFLSPALRWRSFLPLPCSFAVLLSLRV
jgi:hypothetical protein